jgi:hypothetical protein
MLTGISKRRNNLRKNKEKQTACEHRRKVNLNSSMKYIIYSSKNRREYSVNHEYMYVKRRKILNYYSKFRKGGGDYGQTHSGYKLKEQLCFIHH